MPNAASYALNKAYYQAYHQSDSHKRSKAAYRSRVLAKGGVCTSCFRPLLCERAAKTCVVCTESRAQRKLAQKEFF